jgi:hypothetical protein
MLILTGQRLLPAGVRCLVHHPFQKNLRPRITKNLYFSFFPQRAGLLLAAMIIGPSPPKGREETACFFAVFSGTGG